MLRCRRMLLKFLVGCSLVYFGSRLLVEVGFTTWNRKLTSDDRSPVETLRLDNPSTDALFSNKVPENVVKVDKSVQQLAVASSTVDQGQETRRDTERNHFDRLTVEKENKNENKNKADVDSWQQEAALAKPVPFGGNVIPLSSKVSTEKEVTKSIVSLEAAIAEIQPLIDQGLVVPRWSGSTEEPGVPGGQGEYGTAVIVDDRNLTAEERAKYDAGWQNNAFNEYASDIISLHRSLADVRDQECRTLKYRELLPTASVVIIFYNEAWSVLLRTVHSVMDRSPPHLIKEIILVDDFSDLGHLKQPLDDYMAKLLKVRIVRKSKREGLIRARLFGAAAATGDVLIFLDSHCECAPGWLEPLLDRIAESWSNVVAPNIDVVDEKTLKYDAIHARDASVGGFGWGLLFSWHPIPEREQKRRKSLVDPVRSPTMAGGLFAISRKYFEYIGTYDAGMDIWGGENLELSFRVWMCGGILEQVLCSHVGHIFRDRSPYKWPSDVDVLKRNLVRLAEVWMDDYKKYFYERFNYELGEYGDVTDRKELRKKLRCKSFEWYIKNVYPELFIPGEALFAGDIRCQAVGKFTDGLSLCIDGRADASAHHQPVQLWPCHGQSGNQLWLMSKNGEIRRDETCIEYAGQFITLEHCTGNKGNQEWIYGQDKTLRHRRTDLCIQLSSNGTQLDMKPCTGIDRQIWHWRARIQQ